MECITCHREEGDIVTHKGAEVKIVIDELDETCQFCSQGIKIEGLTLQNVTAAIELANSLQAQVNSGVIGKLTAEFIYASDTTLQDDMTPEQYQLAAESAEQKRYEDANPLIEPDKTDPEFLDLTGENYGDDDDTFYDEDEDAEDDDEEEEDDEYSEEDDEEDDDAEEQTYYAQSHRLSPDQIDAALAHGFTATSLIDDSEVVITNTPPVQRDDLPPVDPRHRFYGATPLILDMDDLPPAQRPINVKIDPPIIEIRSIEGYEAPAEHIGPFRWIGRFFKNVWLDIVGVEN